MIDVIDLKISNYRDAYRIQKELAARRAAGEISDTLIVTEHLPVITLGRTGSLENLLIDKTVLHDDGIEFIETDRGGDITFHGPGQLVLYPIIDLRKRERDIRRYLRMLEDVIMSFLSLYGIAGRRVNGKSGVWIDDDTKVGSVGIGVSHWVTYHGLSVNINTPLHYYSMIRPCGLGCAVATVSSLLGRDINMAEAKKSLIDCFREVYEGRSSVLDKEEVYRF